MLSKKVVVCAQVCGEKLDIVFVGRCVFITSIVDISC